MKMKYRYLCANCSATIAVGLFGSGYRLEVVGKPAWRPQDCERCGKKNATRFEYTTVREEK